MFNLNGLFLRDLLKSYIFLPLFVVQSLSHVQFFAIPWTGAHQTSLFFTISQSMLEVMSRDSVMPSNDLHVCHPLLLSSVFASIRVFSDESALGIRWPKSWSFSFSFSPSNEYLDWFPLDLLVWSPCCPRDSQESSPTPQFKISVLQCSTFLLFSSHISTWLLEQP